MRTVKLTRSADLPVAILGVLTAAVVYLVCGVHRVDTNVPSQLFCVMALLTIGYRAYRRPITPGVKLAFGVLGVLAGLGAIVTLWFLNQAVTPSATLVTAAPLTVAATAAGLGFVCIRQRRLGDRTTIGQILAEITLLLSLLSLVIWRLAFVTHVDGTSCELIVTVDVVLACALLAVSVMAIAREPSPRAMLIGCGGALLAGAELFVIHAATHQAIPWFGRVLGITAWIVLVCGVPSQFDRAHVRPSNDQARAGALEARRIFTLTPLVTGLMVLALVSLLAPPAVGVVEAILALTFIGALALRDMLQALRTGRLIGRVRDQALHDPLTRLPNRRALQADTQAIPDGSPVSVLTIDLDDFKAVNDLLGHSTGDSVLASTGSALRTASTWYGATAYRLGGDEFAVVCSGEPAQAENLATTVIRAIDASAGKIAGVTRIGMKASVGVCHVPAQQQQAEAVAHALIRSGHAMRAAKRAGKGRVHVFDDALQDEYRRRKQLEVRLRAGLDRVELDYQPVLSAADAQVVGVEALARWHDDELGDVPPEEFIGIAEDSGLIEELGEQLLDQALSMMSRLNSTGPRLLMAVNVSPLQLRLPDFAGRVIELLERHGADPAQLMLEVTESRQLPATGPTARALRHLSAHGVRLAVDDFGAGSTAIGYLAELPVSVIKIDKSLTSASSRGAIGIVRGIIAMSKDLGKQVAIEGIETPEQLQLAREIGADYVQGWLFSTAVTDAQLPDVLRSLSVTVPVPAQPHR